LAAAARFEDSDATGINGDEASNFAGESGAVYVLTRSTGTWSQEAYVKASNTGAIDTFGRSVALSADGDTLGVGASGEDSDATGINGDEANNLALQGGAVYVFTRSAGLWSQQVYVKASNTGAADFFGSSVALSADGDTLGVGAVGEASSATGINGDEANNSAGESGAVYVFARSAGLWSQQVYVKASNTGAADLFGSSVALSAEGDTLGVGAPSEASSATGINGSEGEDSASFSGAVYVFARSAGLWSQQAYVKASNTGAGDLFGSSAALSADGDTLAVGAPEEDSDATGINGDDASNSAGDSGAVYLY